jgi:hypothetical protein
VLAGDVPDMEKTRNAFKILPGNNTDEYDILYSHGSDHDVYRFPGCDFMYFVREVPTFQRSSTLKIEASGCSETLVSICQTTGQHVKKSRHSSVRTRSYKKSRHKCESFIKK